MTDDQPPDHAHWPKEAQRRAVALQEAERHGASEDDLARLREQVAEADRQIASPSARSSRFT